MVQRLVQAVCLTAPAGNGTCRDNIAFVGYRFLFRSRFHALALLRRRFSSRHGYLHSLSSSLRAAHCTCVCYFIALAFSQQHAPCFGATGFRVRRMVSLDGLRFAPCLDIWVLSAAPSTKLSLRFSRFLTATGLVIVAFSRAHHFALRFLSPLCGTFLCSRHFRIWISVRSSRGLHRPPRTYTTLSAAAGSCCTALLSFHRRTAAALHKHRHIIPALRRVGFLDILRICMPFPMSQTFSLRWIASLSAPVLHSHVRSCTPAAPPSRSFVSFWRTHRVVMVSCSGSFSRVSAHQDASAANGLYTWLVMDRSAGVSNMVLRSAFVTFSGWFGSAFPPCFTHSMPTHTFCLTFLSSLPHTYHLPPPARFLCLPHAVEVTPTLSSTHVFLCFISYTYALSQPATLPSVSVADNGQIGQHNLKGCWMARRWRMRAERAAARQRTSNGQGRYSSHLRGILFSRLRPCLLWLLSNIAFDVIFSPRINDDRSRVVRFH